MGEISGLTGVDDPYEEPVAPDLVIATHEHPVEESVALLLDHLAARGLTGTPARAVEPSAGVRVREPANSRSQQAPAGAARRPRLPDFLLLGAPECGTSRAARGAGAAPADSSCPNR